MKNKLCSYSLYLVIGAFIIVLSYWAVSTIWSLVGIDWHETFYPAAHNILLGKNPYDISTFRNAPWTLLFLLPFAALPETDGGIFYFIATLAAYAWVAYRLKARPLALIAFMFFPPVIYGLRMLNVDVLVLIGFILPAPIGLFLVLIKPQMGIAMVFYWLAEAWRKGRVRSIVYTFAPVTLSSMASFLIFGNWVAGRQSDLLGSTWNASLWPWALPVGLVLTGLAMRDRRPDFGMAASPFLSPYLAYHSWASVLAGLLQYDFQLFIAVIGMWIAGIIHGFSL